MFGHSPQSGALSGGLMWKCDHDYLRFRKYGSFKNGKTFHFSASL